MTEINEALRAHTTQIAFHLTITKTMIATMRYIKMDQMLYEAGLYKPVDGKEYQNVGPRPSLYVTGCHALSRRGMTIALQDNSSGTWDWHKPHSILSPAGERVWDLLVMAGVVEDLQLPANLVTKVVTKRKRA